jgi:Ca2+-binding EF-hand superfamily protein
MRSSQSPDQAGRRGPRSEEMRQRMSEMRQKFDANGDGQLDEEERDALRHARIQDQVKRIDSDGNGAISREEAQAAPSGRMLRDFDAVDANQDSVISPEELEAAVSERQARRRVRWQERRDRESEDATEGSPSN